MNSAKNYETAAINYPKVMLLTPYTKESQGVGKLYLESLVSSYPENRIVHHTIFENLTKTSLKDVWKVKLNKIISKFHQLPLIADFCLWRAKKRAIPKELGRLENAIANREVDVIWTPLNSPDSILLIAKLLKNTRIPVVSVVWDIPEYLAYNANLNAVSRNYLFEKFSYVMSTSSSVVVISERMRENYVNLYRSNVSVLAFCPPVTAPLGNRVFDASRRVATIVFAGSLYATSEWTTLLDCLEDCGRSVNGTKIEVKFIGEHSARVAKRSWVDYLPSLSQQAVLEEISKADIGYLPYWMKDSHSNFVETAFPSKLPSYLSAGLPILFHGPSNSTPADFIRANPAIGATWCSTSRSELCEAITQLLSAGFLHQFNMNVGEIYSEHFSIHKAILTFERLTYESVQRSPLSNKA